MLTTCSSKGQSLTPIPCEALIAPAVQCQPTDTLFVTDRSGLETIIKRVKKDSITISRLRQDSTLQQEVISGLEKKNNLYRDISSVQDSAIYKLKEALQASEELHPGPLDRLVDNSLILGVAVLSTIIATGN